MLLKFLVRIMSQCGNISAKLGLHQILCLGMYKDNLITKTRFKLKYTSLFGESGLWKANNPSFKLQVKWIWFLEIAFQRTPQPSEHSHWGATCSHPKEWYHCHEKKKAFSPPFLVSHRNVFSNMGSNSTQGAAEPNIEASIKDKVPSWTDKKRFTPNITAV